MTLQRFTVRWVLAICGAFGASCDRERGEEIALDWHPELDQPIEQLEEVLAAQQQQQPMNYTSANLGFVLDAKLYLLFERYLASIRAKERPVALDEQRRWLDERRRATHEAYMEYEGGTLASLVGNRAFIEATRERVADLEQRLGSSGAAKSR